MNYTINVREIGFKIGKFTYFGKNISLYRQSPKGNIKKLLIQQKGGSFGYDIQGTFYTREKLRKMSGEVLIQESTLF